jgi:hypothetical protein
LCNEEEFEKRSSEAEISQHREEFKKVLDES